MTIVFNEVSSETSPLTTDLRCSFINLLMVTFLSQKKISCMRWKSHRGTVPRFVGYGTLDHRNGFLIATQTLTSIDLSVESAPQVKIPEGPDPITKTFLLIFSIVENSIIKNFNPWSSIQNFFLLRCNFSQSIKSDRSFTIFFRKTGKFFFDIYSV